MSQIKQKPIANTQGFELLLATKNKKRQYSIDNITTQVFFMNLTNLSEKDSGKEYSYVARNSVSIKSFLKITA